MMMKHKTLPVINKSKHPKKGKYKDQNGRTHVQEDKREDKKATHKGNIKFPDPLLSREALLKGFTKQPP
jgi:hypothetical protein